MNQPAPAAAPTATVPSTPTAENSLGLSGESFEERLSSLQEQVRQEGLTQPAGDAASEAASPATQPTTSPASPADSVEKRTADRRERLRRLQLQEQERNDAQRRRANSGRLEQDLAAANKRAQELEQSRVDRTLLKDPLALLALAEEQGVPADKLVEAIRERLQNPERAAAHAAREAAKKQLDPEMRALNERLERQQQLLDQLLTQNQTAAQRQHEAQAKTHFTNFIGENADMAPTAARLVQADPEEFWSIASIAGEKLPTGAGPQALLDAVEEMLTTDGRALAEKMARLFGLIPDVSSNGTIPPKPAAAKATTTVTNSIAQERASVVTDQDPLSGLSFDERVEYLKRHM